MNKTLIACAIAAGMSLAATGVQADGRGGGHGGGGHGFHGGGGHGFHGGGGHGFHGGSFHGGHGFHGHGFHGHGFGGSIFIGAPLFWPYYGYPAYSYYGYPAATYYDYPAEAYVEPATPQPPTQFYCPDTGYYPAVQTCPRGWLRVVPNSAPQY